MHWMRRALAHVPRRQHTVVAATIRQAFSQPDPEHAEATWRQAVDQIRPRWPKLAALMDESEHDVLACMGYPAQHRSKSSASSASLRAGGRPGSGRARAPSVLSAL